jgi:hypothetical protein
MDFTYNWGFILFGLVQHETYNPKRFDLKTTRECENLSLVQWLPHSQAFTNPMSI